jgi:hypothetical protein
MANLKEEVPYSHTDLLPYPINILMATLGTDQELLAHLLIAPPGISGQLHLIVLVNITIQCVSNKRLNSKMLM